MGVGARRPQVVAEAAAPDQRPVRRGRTSDGDDDEGVEPDAGGHVPIGARGRVEAREPAALGDRLGADGEARLVGLEVAGEQERRQPEGDRVEHDRGDHLADAPVGAQHAGDAGPPGPDEDGDGQDAHDPEGPGQRQGRTGGGGHHPGQAVLALDPDVEQVHLEPDGHGHTRDVVRPRPVEGPEDLADARHLVEEEAEDLARRVAREEQGEGGRDAGEDDRQRRCRQREQKTVSLHRCTIRSWRVRGGVASTQHR